MHACASCEAPIESPLARFCTRCGNRYGREGPDRG